MPSPLRFTVAVRKRKPVQHVIKNEWIINEKRLDPVVLKTGTSIEQDEALSARRRSSPVDSFKGLERKAVILALESPQPSTQTMRTLCRHNAGDSAPFNRCALIEHGWIIDDR